MVFDLDVVADVLAVLVLAPQSARAILKSVTPLLREDANTYCENILLLRF